MKTEKEYSDFFIECYQKLSRELRLHKKKSSYLVNDTYVNNMAPSYWLDLTVHLQTYFTDEDRLQITKKAADLFAEKLDTASDTLTPEQAWQQVILSFVQNNYWDFQTIAKKPKIKKTEEQEIFWKFFKYTWAFIQSIFIIKAAVYFFGLEAASHPEQISIGWMWLFFAISVSSLIFFAYRNRNDKD